MQSQTTRLRAEAQNWDEAQPRAMAVKMAGWCKDASRIRAYVNSYFGRQVVTREFCEKAIADRKRYLGPNIRDWTEAELEREKPKPVEVVSEPQDQPVEVVKVPQWEKYWERAFDLRLLIQTVADALDVTYGEIIGLSRKARFVHARAVIVMVLRERGWSYPQCAKAINRSDHSTTINQCDKFAIYCSANPKLAEVFEACRAKARAQ